MENTKKLNYLGGFLTYLKRLEELNDNKRNCEQKRMVPHALF